MEYSSTDTSSSEDETTEQETNINESSDSDSSKAQPDEETSYFDIYEGARELNHKSQTNESVKLREKAVLAKLPDFPDNTILMFRCEYESIKEEAKSILLHLYKARYLEGCTYLEDNVVCGRIMCGCCCKSVRQEIHSFSAALAYIKYYDTPTRDSMTVGEYMYKINALVYSIYSKRMPEYVSVFWCGEDTVILALLSEKKITMQDCQKTKNNFNKIIVPAIRPVHSGTTMMITNSIKKSIPKYIKKRKINNSGDKESALQRIEILNKEFPLESLLWSVYDGIENGWKNNDHPFYFYPRENDKVQIHKNFLYQFGMYKDWDEWSKMPRVKALTDDKNQLLIYWKYTKIMNHVITESQVVDDPVKTIEKIRKRKAK